MKGISLIAVAAVLAATSASAADINGKRQRPLDLPEPRVVETAELVNWTGFYIGGTAGYGKTQHDVEVRQYEGGGFTVPPIGALDADPAPVPGEVTDAVNVGSIGLNGLGAGGFVGGGRVGFDQAFGSFLIGVLADYSFSNSETTLEASITGVGGEEYALEKGDSWMIGARTGLIIAPRTMAYVMAAYTEGDFEITGPGVTKGPGFNPEKTLSGIAVGGGVEYALTGNVFLGLEALYTAYDEETWFNGRDEAGNGTEVSAETDELKVLGTLKLKLGSGLPKFND